MKGEKKNEEEEEAWFVATLGAQRLETFNCTWKRLELFSWLRMIHGHPRQHNVYKPPALYTLTP